MSLGGSESASEAFITFVLQYRISEEDLDDFTNGEQTVTGFMARHI